MERRPPAHHDITQADAAYLGELQADLIIANRNFIEGINHLLDRGRRAGDIARLLGTNRSTLYRWLRGESVPRVNGPDATPASG